MIKRNEYCKILMIAEQKKVLVKQKKSKQHPSLIPITYNVDLVS